MSQPMEPEFPHRDEGVPAVDAGAPPPADGYGTGGEEPDVSPADGDAPESVAPSHTPFRTPDPDAMDTNPSEPARPPE
jgi:hypothetical protein